jgi:hypothetical protein
MPSFRPPQSTETRWGRRNSRSRQGCGTNPTRDCVKRNYHALERHTDRRSSLRAGRISLSINPPHRDPPAALLFDGTFLVPTLTQDFSYARLLAHRTGDAGIVAPAARSFVSIHERSVSRRTSFRRPRDRAGIAAQPCMRPAIALQTCAFEQCNNSANR